jgi:hypothetical protein
MLREGLSYDHRISDQEVSHTGEMCSQREA